MGALGLISEQEIRKLDLRICISNEAFGTIVNNNLKGMGLPPLDGVMKGLGAALGISIALTSAVNTYGTKVTVNEALRATNREEKLKGATKLLAAYYAGAIIGSIFIATVGTTGCSRSKSIRGIDDFIKNTGLKFESPKVFFANNPEILNTSMSNREAYAKRASAD